MRADEPGRAPRGAAARADGRRARGVARRAVPRPRRRRPGGLLRRSPRRVGVDLEPAVGAVPRAGLRVRRRRPRGAGPGRRLGADGLGRGPGRGAVAQPGPRPPSLHQGRGLRLDGGQPPPVRPLRLHAGALVRGAGPTAGGPAGGAGCGRSRAPSLAGRSGRGPARRAQRGLRRPLGIGAGRRGVVALARAGPRRPRRPVGGRGRGGDRRGRRPLPQPGLPGGRRAHRATGGLDREPGHGRPVARPRRRLVHDRLVDAGLRRGGLLPRHDRRRHRQPHRRGAALPQRGVRARAALGHPPDRAHG